MPGNPLESQRFGSHLSVAGGFENAFNEGAQIGCDCLQIFVKNQKQWSAKPLTDEIIRNYRSAQRSTGIKPVIAHSSYLINLASPKPDLRKKSIDAVVDELERCEALGVPGLVQHPGAHMGDGVEAGIARIASALDEVHERTAGVKVKVLLETTAGQGTSIGHEIEHLGSILRIVKDADRLGICLDTCHLFAAGYDLRSAEEYDRTIELLRRQTTLRRIKCIHVNDSKNPCGSRKDRHTHIGQGELGLDAFRNLVNDARLAGVPKILETPEERDAQGVDYDVVNLRTLRGLIDCRK